jgi:hypothetical protein
MFEIQNFGKFRPFVENIGKTTLPIILPNNWLDFSKRYDE